MKEINSNKMSIEGILGFKPEASEKGRLHQVASNIADSNSVSLSMLPSVVKSLDLVASDNSHEAVRVFRNAQSAFKSLVFGVTEALKKDNKQLEAKSAAKVILICYYHKPELVETDLMKNFIWFIDQNNIFETI